MQHSLDALIKQSFKSAAGWKFYLSCILLFAATTLLSLVAGFFGFTATGLIFAQPDRFMLALGLLLFALLLLAWTLAETFISGIAYNLAFQSFDKKFSLKDSLKKAIGRIVPAFMQQLLYNIIILAVLCIVFAPMIMHVFAHFSNVDSKLDLQLALAGNDSTYAFSLVSQAAGEFAAQNSILFAAELLVAILLAIAFLPAIVLLLPAVLFGNGSAVGSMKEALRLGFRNFFSIYAFIIVLAIITALLMLAGEFFLELATVVQDSVSYYIVSALSFLVGAFSFGIAFPFLTGAFKLAAQAPEAAKPAKHSKASR